jgi:A/G-specific adenine glycosylase
MIKYSFENSEKNMADEAKETVGETCTSSRAWGEEFRHLVLEWFNIHGRTFPWRITSNPFHVLIAEILLRQTQAERVASPYQELVSRYPDAHTLSKADAETLRSWFRPLGLVKRSGLLVQAAKVIVSEYNGEVPSDLKQLLRLPGIGTYSARAILCLAFGVSVPMIDESSGRLLRRVLGLGYNGPAFADRRLLERVESMFPRVTTKKFNLGLLDLAARYCRPKSPDCPECPLHNLCTHDKSTKIKLDREK